MRASEETYRIREQRRRVTTASRVALAAAALLLLSVYFVPIWKISLQAPQYPEGLGMYIDVNNIRGERPGNLESINGLNHYIGMKAIHPESIPELKLMPWLYAALIGLGLAAAASGRKWALFAWVGLFVVFAVAGLVDFYLWEYDYGHNLDHDRAIIKVPGMTYQPPLIGSKKMLNITAVSLPALGGILTIASLLIGVAVSVVEIRRRALLASVPVLAAAMLLGGCATGPRPIAYGEDVCHHCKMIATDERFGAEFVNEHGKAYVFDSIECLTAFMASGDMAGGTAFVTVMNRPGMLIPVSEAFFAHGPGIPSPMSAHLGAFDSAEVRDDFLETEAGEALMWDDVAALGGYVHQHGPESAAEVLR